MNDVKFRTTRDLIEELDREAPKFSELMLAVGFETTTVLIASSDADRFEALDVAIAEGGEPVGFIGFTTFGSRTIFYHRVLEEYRGEEWAEDWLTGLIGLAEGPADMTECDTNSGWLN